MDNLKQDQKKIEVSLQNLQEDLKRGYRTLSMLNEKNVINGNINGVRSQQKNEEQEHFFTRQLCEVENNLIHCYSEQRRLIDKETEELYKKRGEISWD